MSLHKLTRKPEIFANDESALKIVTLRMLEASKKWTVPIKNRGKALGHFTLKHPEIAELIKS